MRNMMIAIIMAAALLPLASAATISVSQAGADAGTVMKGLAFTVTVSGISSSGTVALSLPPGFSTEESTTKSFSEGTSSVSWTAIMADQKLSAQTIGATVTTGGSPENLASSAFDVVLPPSFVASATPSSFSASNYNGTYYANITFTVQNWGETIAKDVVATLLRPTNLGVVSGYSDAQTIGTITGGTGGSGESKGLSWKLYASSAVSGSLQIFLTSSNTETLTTSIPFSLSFVTTTTVAEEAADSTGPVSGQSTTTTIATASQFWPNMTKGSYYSLSDIPVDIGFTTINISLKNSSTNVRITVTRLAAKPSFIASDAPGTSYKYIEVSPVNLQDSNIESAKIRFSVEKWWLNLNNLDKTGVLLYRYSGGSWQRLNTTIIGETSNYDNYEAVTPGFSTFAISVGAAGSTATTTTVIGGAEAPGSEETAGNNETGGQTGGEQGLGTADSAYLGTAFVVVIIIIIAAIAFLKKDEIQKHMKKIKPSRKKDTHQKQPPNAHVGEHKETEKK